MIKYTTYDIVFQEIPDETTLAINISNCPHRCSGCHSPELWEDVGEELTFEIVKELYNKYPHVTVICFMGGDSEFKELCKLSNRVNCELNIATAMYSGNTSLKGTFYHNMLYVKIGPYIEELGPITNPSTNQRLYKRQLPFSEHDTSEEWEEWEDITYKFWKQSNLETK